MGYIHFLSKENKPRIIFCHITIFVHICIIIMRIIHKKEHKWHTLKMYIKIREYLHILL